MTHRGPSAARLVAAQTLREAAGALVSPIRLLLFVLFGRGAERRRLDAALAAERTELPPAPAPPPEPADGPPLTIFVAAGEASGEMHVVNLIRALRQRRARLRFVGFGGARLRDEGVDVVAALGERAGMGLLHGLRSIPRALALAKAFVECLDRERPDICLFMDNPGFHLVLASLARARGVPAVQYVCPQIWAWAPWRASRLRRDAVDLFAILPFEVPYFASRGISVRYVGHPLGDVPRRSAAPTGVKGHSGPIVLFAGSRAGEVRRLAPSLARVAAALTARDPSLRFVFSLPNETLASLVRASMLQAPNVLVASGDPAPWLANAPLAIVKSGTGSLEAARYGIPLVIVYRIARAFDRWLSRRLLTVPHIATLNLLARGEVVPEILFVREDEEMRITEAAWRLLAEPAARSAQLAAVAALRPWFDVPGASARSAAALLERVEALGAPRSSATVPAPRNSA